MAAAKAEDQAGGPDLAWLEWGGAILLTVWTVWAHCLRFIHAGGLWRDEAAAVRLANLPSLGEVFRMFPHEAFPLAVPMTIRLFTHLAGNRDGAFRGLGLAVGLAITTGLWINARLAGRGVPLLSMTLIGGNAAFIVFGDEMRGYGLGSLCILASFIALARLLARPSVAAAALALAAIVAAVHCLLANAALVGALGAAAAITAMWRGRRRLALVVVGLGLAAALSLVPYAAPLAAAARAWDAVVVYPTTSSQVLNMLWATLGPGPARWAWLLAVVFGLAAPWRLAAGRREDSRTATATASAQAPGGAALAAAEDDVWRFSGLTILFAMTAEMVFLKVLSYSPRAWYYLPLLTLIAAAVERLDAGWRHEAAARPARLLLAAVLAAVLLPEALPQLYQRMTNVDLAASHLTSEAGAGDLVVVSPWYLGVSFDRYFHGPASWLTLPDLADHRMHRYDLVRAKLVVARPIDDVLDRIRRTLVAGQRVWLVGDLRFPPAGHPAPILPPAPTPQFGWHDFFYNIAWTLQAGAFLRDHARTLQAVPIPAPDRVSRLETVSMVVAAGWRDRP